LQRLKLSHCGLDSNRIKRIVLALRTARPPLSSIDFSHNQIDCEGAASIAQLSCLRAITKNLTLINLEHNRLAKQGALEIIETFSSKTTDFEIKLEGNQIDSSAIYLSLARSKHESETELDDLRKECARLRNAKTDAQCNLRELLSAQSTMISDMHELKEKAKKLEEDRNSLIKAFSVMGMVQHVEERDNMLNRLVKLEEAVHGKAMANGSTASVPPAGNTSTSDLNASSSSLFGASSPQRTGVTRGVGRSKSADDLPPPLSGRELSTSTDRSQRHRERSVSRGPSQRGREVSSGMDRSLRHRERSVSRGPNQRGRELSSGMDRSQRHRECSISGGPSQRGLDRVSSQRALDRTPSQRGLLDTADRPTLDRPSLSRVPSLRGVDRAPSQRSLLASVNRPTLDRPTLDRAPSQRVFGSADRLTVDGPAPDRPPSQRDLDRAPSQRGLHRDTSQRGLERELSQRGLQRELSQRGLQREPSLRNIVATAPTPAATLTSSNSAGSRQRQLSARNLLVRAASERWKTLLKDPAESPMRPTRTRGVFDRSSSTKSLSEFLNRSAPDGFAVDISESDFDDSFGSLLGEERSMSISARTSRSTPASLGGSSKSPLQGVRRLMEDDSTAVQSTATSASIGETRRRMRGMSSSVSTNSAPKSLCTSKRSKSPSSTRGTKDASMTKNTKDGSGSKSKSNKGATTPSRTKSSGAPKGANHSMPKRRSMPPRKLSKSLGNISVSADNLLGDHSDSGSEASITENFIRRK